MKFLKKILYPHVAVLLVIFPISMVLMICSLVFLGSTEVISIVSYVLAFYSLSVVVLRIPNMIEFAKKIKDDNKYIKKLTTDTHFRINLFLYGSLVWNIIYAVFQLCLGFYHMSFWFYSMAIYYIMLAVMRFYIVRYTTKHQAGESYEIELKKYNLCGWLLLFMNLAISIIIFYIIYWGRTFYHHQITTIALAAYTFVTFTFAIINFIKYRKFNSPVYLATKVISLVAACVSMVTLTTTMLTTFGTDDIYEFKKIILTFVGTFVSIFIIIMSVMIIIKTKKELNKIKGKYSEKNMKSFI
jgi:hypothetical protein